MGRTGTMVELRAKSIRVNFTLNGEWKRVKLALPPTPANARYAEKLVNQVKQAIDRGTFTRTEYFPDAPEARRSKPAHSFGEWCALRRETKGRMATKTLNQYRNALKVWQELFGLDADIDHLTHATMSAKVGGTPWKSAKLLKQLPNSLTGRVRASWAGIEVGQPNGRNREQQAPSGTSRPTFHR